MTQTTALLIFTDLDGTLLDHHSYDAGPALGTIRRLNQAQIPWLFNTSKTLAEVLALSHELDNAHPLVVENGGGIAIPDHYTPPLAGTETLSHQRGFGLKTIGVKREYILEILAPLRTRFKFRGFSEIDTEELAELTGLGLQASQQALQREFSEPLLWRDDDQKLQEFRQILAAANLQLLIGGRFIHVVGNSDKGTAMDWLSAGYRHSAPKLLTIALGDGQNDVAMLERADIAVVIRSPVNPPPEFQARGTVYLTEQTGPAGWAEALNPILDRCGIADAAI